MLRTCVSLEPLHGRIVLQPLADPVASLVIKIQCNYILRYVLEQLRDVFTSKQLKSLITYGLKS